MPSPTLNFRVIHGTIFGRSKIPIPVQGDTPIPFSLKHMNCAELFLKLRRAGRDLVEQLYGDWTYSFEELSVRLRNVLGLMGNVKRELFRVRCDDRHSSSGTGDLRDR